MAFKVADRVQETATSPGTGTVTLQGASTGYVSFSAGIGANNTTYYVIADQSGANWEIGLGTVGAGGTTLVRTTVLASSNSGSLVNFSSGSQYVWADYTALKAMLLDASGKVNAGGNGYLDFSSVQPAVAAGRMWYDDTTGSWNLGMGGGNITQQVGEELFVYGKASAAITDSPLQIIKQTGVVGSSGAITFAPTTSGITNGDLIIGVATESIALNGFGRITAFGVVHGVTTNGTAYGETWADGDTIWYNPVTGNPTNVKPVAPNIKVSVGVLIKAGSGGSGSIAVEISHGSVLGGTDSNVEITSPTRGQILIYDNVLGYWKNANANGLLWQSVQTSNFTATANSAYPVNTTSGAITVNLPASPTVGQQVTVLDYAGTAATNSITIAGNGAKINGSNVNNVIRTAREGITFVYIDSTQGWLGVSSIVGTDYSQQLTVSLLTVAGGGGGGGGYGGVGGGGAGAGGYLASTYTLTQTSTAYSVVIGGGGAGGPGSAGYYGGQGGNTTVSGGSIGLTILGGGYAAGYDVAPSSGGSGGGSAFGNTPGSGTSGQGNAGGTGNSSFPAIGGGGGGGASAVGGNGSSSLAGNGGAGSTFAPNSTAYAGGGGGGADNYVTASTGGSGVGGVGGVGGPSGGTPANGGNAVANRGGGGGGGANNGGSGGNGSAGVVIFAYPGSAAVATGGTITVSGGYVFHTFTTSGTFTF